VDAAALLEGRLTAENAADWAMSNCRAQPIVYSTSPPEDVKASQDRFGTMPLAEAVETFFGKLARHLVNRGMRRLVVGGGETAGAVIGALGIQALTVGSEIDPGVPALAAESEPRLGLVLKSGNFGTPDFYDKALIALGTA
jgi:uncharacterized protein YgbK (DUF1537 family)